MSVKRFRHRIKGFTNVNRRIHRKNCRCYDKEDSARKMPRIAKKIGIKGPKGAHPSKVVPGPAALAPNAMGRMYL